MGERRSDLTLTALIERIAHAFLRLIGQGRGYTKEQADAALVRASDVAAELRQWSGGISTELISLGQNCSVSWYIKAIGQKRASYPFDWLATSPNVLEHVLDDDFHTLLNRSQMIPLVNDSGSRVYHAQMYGHRNPARNDADYAYYVRCVERWRDRLESSDNITFIGIVLNEHAKRPRVSRWFTDAFVLPQVQTYEHWRPVVAAIGLRHTNSRFLFLEQYTDVPFNLSLSFPEPDVAWLRIATQGRSTGVRYLNQTDDEVMRMVMGEMIH